jgi:hypothetical protein
VTFTQNNEEEQAILAWADGRDGSFLDLGCYDGAAYSTTAALADRGWPGLCVDAAPDAAAACALRYRDQDAVEVLLAAFDPAGSSSPALVYWTPGAMNTSLLPERRADEPGIPLLVPRLPLDWLGHRLENQPTPLFCSIDLEGGSIDALEWLLAEVDVACFCVEANNPGERARVAELLDGWTPLEVNPWNSIFARAEVSA